MGKTTKSSQSPCEALSSAYQDGGRLARLHDSATRMSEEEGKHIQDLLGQIQADLEDAQAKSKRYNPAIPDDGSIRLETLAERFKRQAHARQRRTPLGEVVKWALRDARKCRHLVEDIEHGIDKLEKALTQTATDSQLAHQAAVEDAQQLIQPSEVEEPAEPDAEPIIDVLKEALSLIHI